jgi:alpha-L-fucosidase 2
MFNIRLMKRLFIVTGLVFLSLTSFGQLRLWYDRPASVWEETLPLGNGRLGMMPDGGINNERIVLNDITLWSGAPQDANNYEAYKLLPKIRQLLADGKNDEAQELMNTSFVCTGKGSGDVPFGCFQTLGELNIQFDSTALSLTNITNYHRELSINKAIASTSFQSDGVTYTREYFTSFADGDDVDVIRLRASKPGQINCKVMLSRPEKATVQAVGHELQMYGQLNSGNDTPGMSYLTRVGVKLSDGSYTADKGALVIRNATEAVIIISSATDFRNPGYKEQTAKALANALRKPFALQRQQHIAGFQKLFNRVQIDLGASKADTLSTDKRLLSFHNQPSLDNGLPVLFYQFGRYLSISSTSKGLLPPNLQGLWANQVHTPWNGDYHLDVNVQMNHWPVEVGNLSELDLPLAELVKGMVAHGAKTAKAYYNADGWVAHVITNPWAFTEPGESASWGLTKSGSGWLCNNLWEHYAFTNDTQYLRNIYPVLKGAAEFYSSMLVQDTVKKTVRDSEHVWLVTSPSSSPENSFYLPNGKTASICNGPTIDNQIIRELFTNVITATKILGIDNAFSKVLATKLTQLPPPGRISADGSLMEWLEDYKQTDVHHRHISHLYGLYPANLITPESTPDLAEACKKTLNARGDDGPSWSIAYKLLFWARLHDGNRAYQLFTALIRPTLKTDINYGAGGGVYPNLLSAGPPFQIDGNFGAEAGLAEMLLQSHAGFIDLLPALPDAWKASGSVSGLKARGNYTVSFSWKNGQVNHIKITHPTPAKVKVRMNGVMQELLVTKN